MTFDRTTRIDTPEGVRLDLTLAGVGSRVGAQLIDGLIKSFVGVALFFLFVSGFRAGATIFVIVFSSLALLGYELVFEAAWGGRTPGKAAFGIRVVNLDGSAVGFSAVLVRNLMRLIDILPTLYIVAVILVFTTKRHQRLGDLAAGTIVIRDRKGSDKSEFVGPSLHFDVPPGFDATAVSAQDVAIIRQFLTRVDDLEWSTATRLTSRMAEPLRSTVFVAGAQLDDLNLLKAIVAFKAR